MPYFYIKQPRSPYSDYEFQDAYRTGTTAAPSTTPPLEYPHPQDERAPKFVSRMEGEGRKFDQGKPDFTLLPWDSLAEVVKVLQYGCEKYERDNWKHVPDAFQRYEAAGLRHRVARLNGEAVDPESGFSHLAHEACCLLFQLWLEQQEKSTS